MERGREEYKDYAHYPKAPQHPHQHTWNNSNPASSRTHSPSPSPEPKKKNLRRKVKKSESESGITKLFKTLRKEGGFGKKSSDRDLRGRGLERSPERRGQSRLQTRRGSLDRSPSRKRNSSPDRRRAKSMDRRADRWLRDCSPDSRTSSQILLRQTATPERQSLPQKEPYTPARSYLREECYLTSTLEGSNNSQALPMARGLTPERGLKNGNVLWDASPSSRNDRLSSGASERCYRRESVSSSNGSYLEEAATPRLKDYYNALKANGANGTNAGRAPTQHLQSKTRLYKENHTDLSI